MNIDTLLVYYQYATNIQRNKWSQSHQSSQHCNFHCRNIDSASKLQKALPINTSWNIVDIKTRYRACFSHGGCLKKILKFLSWPRNRFISSILSSPSYFSIFFLLHENPAEALFAFLILSVWGRTSKKNLKRHFGCSSPKNGLSSFVCLWERASFSPGASSSSSYRCRDKEEE